MRCVAVSDRDCGVGVSWYLQFVVYHQRFVLLRLCYTCLQCVPQRCQQQVQSPMLVACSFCMTVCQQRIMVSECCMWVVHTLCVIHTCWCWKLFRRQVMLACCLFRTHRAIKPCARWLWGHLFCSSWNRLLPLHAVDSSSCAGQLNWTREFLCLSGIQEKVIDCHHRVCGQVVLCG